MGFEPDRRHRINSHRNGTADQGRFIHLLASVVRTVFEKGPIVRITVGSVEITNMNKSRPRAGAGLR